PHGKPRSAAWVAVDVDPAPEGHRGPRAQVQAQPDSADPAGGGAVELFELLEDPRDVVRGDPDAVVDHVDADPPVLPPGHQPDVAVGVLERVVAQVEQD